MLYILTSKWDCPIEGRRVSGWKMVRQHKLTPEPWEFRKQWAGEDSDGTCPLCPASYYHTDKASIKHGRHRGTISLPCMCVCAQMSSGLSVWSRPLCFPKCFQGNQTDSLTSSQSNRPPYVTVFQLERSKAPSNVFISHQSSAWYWCVYRSEVAKIMKKERLVWFTWPEGS